MTVKAMPDKITFVQARHEEMAAFMATAYAKFSGGLGICIATSGPGASHLITGLYDARLEHMPVFAILSQQSRDAIGGHYQQEVDLVSLFKDVAGVRAAVVRPGGHLIDRAIRIALGDRRVTVKTPRRPLNVRRALVADGHSRGAIRA
jgi:pyruvate dehydrogenase (quinone)